MKMSKAKYENSALDKKMDKQGMKILASSMKAPKTVKPKAGKSKKGY